MYAGLAGMVLVIAVGSASVAAIVRGSVKRWKHRTR